MSLYMRRTFPKPWYFHFLIFRKTVLINFIIFKFVFGKQNCMHLTVSPRLIVYNKNSIFQDNIFGVTFI